VYAAVQGGHALADFLLRKKQNDWNNNYLIYLTVRDEKALQKLRDKLIYKDIEIGSFKEPDLKDELTALAIENNQSLFKRLQVL
jgi:hypothetical protein